MASSRFRRLFVSVAVAMLSTSRWRATRHAFVPAPRRGAGRRDVLAQGLLLGSAPAVFTAGTPPASARYVRWVGEYQDPKHPGCERTIEKNGPDYRISGTSSTERGQKACSKTKEVKRWFLDGSVDSSLPGVGNTMEVDLPFAPVAGLAKLRFDPDVGSQGGLIFPDGTVWEKAGPLVRKSQSVEWKGEQW